MKKSLICSIIALAFVSVANAQTTRTYNFPSTGKLVDVNGNRINRIDYADALTCANDAIAYVNARRKTSTAKNIIAHCDSRTTYTNEQVPLPPSPPVIVPQPPAPPPPPVTPPAPPAAVTPGLGTLPVNPRVNAGSLDVRISATSEQPGAGDGTGDFRTVCAPSHFAFDDPIVFPGQPGKSHMHLFFGSTSADAFTTVDNIRTRGGSTCRAGTANRSAYWVPALIDMATGLPAVPDDSNFYYKSGYEGVAPNQIRPIPAGLRMIAGDSKNTKDISNPYVPYMPYFWSCRNTPNTLSHTIPNCPVGDQLSMDLMFPQCWDGVNLDSPDHKSHMAYPVDHKGCPPTHPVALPEISFHVLYPVSRAGQYSGHRLSSDTYDGPAGYSTHGDWFNGWDPAVSDAWGLNCVKAGKDCHSHLLGDGRAIY